MKSESMTDVILQFKSQAIGYYYGTYAAKGGSARVGESVQPSAAAGEYLSPAREEI
jgi:hypothetical protein